MKKSALVLAAIALIALPSSAFATFSVIQDSCRVQGNTVITYFSVVNFNSAIPLCDFHFEPENPVPGCIIIDVGSGPGWIGAENQFNSGADWAALTPADCITAGHIVRGFSFTLDPDFCCYLVHFHGANHEDIVTQEECFDCVHVGTESKPWSGVKRLYQ